MNKEQRRLARERKERQKAREKAHAASQVAQFEGYLEALVSVHKDAPSPWDWGALVNSSPPQEPGRRSTSEESAKRALAAYRPGFFEKLFGGEKKKRVQLEVAVAEGKAQDDEEYRQALRGWKEACAEWQLYCELGKRVLTKEQAAYSEVLEQVGAFDEVAKYQTVVRSGAAQPSAIMLEAEIRDDEIVPTEIVKQTAAGKLTSKAMPKGQYWELYQDHVCSCAIRLGCEIFAALPVDRAIINVGRTEVSSTTGHPELVTYLGVHFTRDQLAKINLDRIDPL